MKAIIIGLCASVLILICTNLYTVFGPFKESVKDATYWRNEKFKTDTVWVKETYTVETQSRILYPDSVPPKIVYHYLPDTTRGRYLDFNDPQFVHVIDSLLKTQVRVDRTFLTQYPSAHKLIFSSLNKDTLSFDLLGINGQIRREVYPIDLSLFKYQYVDNSLRAIELSARERGKLPKKNFISYDGTYINYERDFINKVHIPDITSSISIGRVKIGGFARQPLGNGRPFEAGTRVGYKLF